MEMDREVPAGESWSWIRQGCQICSGYTRVAIVSVSGADEDEMNRRGHLIAAAPDMLEELQAAEELWKVGLLAAAPGQIERVNQLRRSALRKATGSEAQ